MCRVIAFVALVAVVAAMPFGHWTRIRLPHRSKDRS